MIFDTGVTRPIRTQINDRSQGLKHYLQSAPYSQASHYTKPRKKKHSSDTQRLTSTPPGYMQQTVQAV